MTHESSANDQFQGIDELEAELARSIRGEDQGVRELGLRKER
jgi:hypothetical protein